MSEKTAAPEGGRGYLIIGSIIGIHIACIIPYNVFGIIFGEFLASLGDEARGTSLSVSIAMTIACVIGLFASYLYKYFSFRQVGLGGACMHFTAFILVLFVNSLPLFILTYSVMGGIGCGLMITSTFSSLNEYFVKKLNLATGIAQLFVAVFSMIYPFLVTFIYTKFGFFYIKLYLLLCSATNFVSMWMLKPIEGQLKTSEGTEMQEKEKFITENEKHNNTERPKKTNETDDKIDKIENGKSVWDLLKSPKCLNLLVGLSLSFSADNLFASLFRLILNNLGFTIYEIATLSTVHYAFDVVARILYIIISALYPIRNRYVFFGGVLVTIIFRTAFVFRDDFAWKCIMLAVLGFARCLIQVTFTLIVAEEYREDFPNAISLAFVSAGLMALLLGQGISLVKELTNSDVMIVHLLTVALIVTAVTWSVEFVWKYMKNKK